MKITIVGAGRVGVHLAKYFASEQQDVFLVDRDSEKLSVLESDFNLRTIQGDAIDFDTLREAKTQHSDVFVSVTGSTSDNLVACAMAKSLGSKKTIARVDKNVFIESVNAEMLAKMGVDHVVFPDFLAAQAILGSLEHSWTRSWNELFGGAIVLIAVSVKEKSPICGLYLKDLSGDSEFMHVSALRRRHETIIPRGDDIIAAEDVLYITTTSAGLGKVVEATGKEIREIKRVLVMGGSNVAELLVKYGSKRFSFVLMEKSPERCRELIQKCPDCEVIYGDGSEQDVLEEAGIHRAEAFVSLADNSESNILACLTAKENGVYRTIAEVEKEQYIAKAESFKIGSIINKPIITAQAIFQLILDADGDSSKCFVMADAEVANMEIKEGSYLTEKPVKDLKIPRELTFGGLVRDGKGVLVTGNTEFRAGDKVIVFCMPGALDKVEKLFKK